MTADAQSPVPAPPAIRSPGVTLERSIRLNDQWFAEVCLWLGRRIGDMGAIGWPMVLIPEVVDKRLGLSERTMQVYQRVSWTTEVPHVPFTVQGGTEWVSVKGDSLEIGLWTRALGPEGMTADGAPIAEGLLVAREPGKGESFGTRALPPVPDVGTLKRRRTHIINETSVLAFADLAGTRYPIHEDARHAWKLGYPNILVQGLIIFLMQLHHEPLGSAGQAEMWFRQVIPAGTLIEMCYSVEDPDVWAFRLTSSGELAAVARIRRERNGITG